jgi:hypothetical protein
MATDTTDKVQTNGPDVADIDFAEIAANLGVQFKPAPKAEETEKPTDETTEPDAETSGTDAADKEPDSEPAAEDAGDTEEKTDEDDAEPDEGEGADEEDKAEEAEAPTKVQQRIDKLTAQKREALEQLDDLKAQLEAAKAAAEAKPPVIFKDPDNPLSSFTDAAALEAEIAKAQAVLDWTDDHRDGGTVTVAGEEKYYDADAVKQIRANARALVKAGPKQQEYIRVREATLPEAKAFYPEFFQPGTSAHQFLQATLKQYPTITQFPNWELIVGDAFAGQQLRMTRVEQMQKRASNDKTKKAPAKAEAATGKVPKAPTPSASPKVSSSSSAALRQKAESVLKARGDRNALEAFMESIM